MEIEAHEDYLPRDTAKSAAVVFELTIPDFLRDYRNATWKIFGLGYPTKIESAAPVQMLLQYEPLVPYVKKTVKGSSAGITLASTTKSFRGTHYRVARRKMKATEADVLYPNGLTLSYFDSDSSTWIADYDTSLTFQHLCGAHIPVELRDTVMPICSHPPPQFRGPSSYDIIASETQCPSRLSVHEFTAYQRLFTGISSRWLTIIVQLGSSELNFSRESTMLSMNHLATQAGSSQNDNGVLRDSHICFAEKTFCDRLAQQIEYRMNSIASNWREVHFMEILLTLTLRLFVLSQCNHDAENLLVKARQITLQWISQLRTQVRETRVSAAAKTAANYAFWAALLCRRTFAMYEKSEEHMSGDNLRIFVQASLALQENLLVDLTNLQPTLKDMLIRDVKMAYNLQKTLVLSIKMYPDSINSAIQMFWWNSEHSFSKTFTEWEIVAPRWVVSTMTTRFNASSTWQIVHYNFIEGHLLVDGKPLGRLPREIHESTVVLGLFGDQHLLTFASPMPGMSYVSATLMEGNEIHFGIRNGQIIVQTVSNYGHYEFIPPHVFSGRDAIDLPDGLITDCTHWLNIGTQCIEIRRSPYTWKTRQRDWRVDLTKRSANRGQGQKTSGLVDPCSKTFKQIAAVFRYFELPSKITVYQPSSPRGRLSVELRHLELSFYVNDKGRLQCRELQEEIDPNQDAGTFYGLQSMIVLCDPVDELRRSIIVPIGKISTKRLGMHVAVRAANDNNYGRFEIDDVLGRLKCPVEPRLLYTKTYLHAVTSFPLPDPLTGRTGTEEALHMLHSGFCQPWTPLPEDFVGLIRDLAALSPERNYYPPDLEYLQTVKWNQNLTMSIQHDAFEGLVHSIWNRSEELRVFSMSDINVGHLNSATPPHLRDRGLLARVMYEKSAMSAISGNQVDVLYESKRKQGDSTQASKVYQICQLLLMRPYQLHLTRDLATTLRDWPLIGGFQLESDGLQSCLSDLTSGNIAEQWGTIVQACRNTDSAQVYKMMFRLALLSLNPKTDFNVLKILTAFVSLPSVRDIEPPQCNAYSLFSLNETPTAASLFDIISAVLPEKPKRKLYPAEAKYRNECEAECMELARHVLAQWPSETISLAEFRSEHIDVGLAMERMTPRWQQLHHNLELSRFVQSVQTILDLYQRRRNFPIPNCFIVNRAWNSLSSSATSMVALDDVLTTSIRPLKDIGGVQLFEPELEAPYHPLGLSDTVFELRQILSSFMLSDNILRQQYGQDLGVSLAALQESSSRAKKKSPRPARSSVEVSISRVRGMLQSHLSQLHIALSTGDDRYQWLSLGDLWPCLTSTRVVEKLGSRFNTAFGENVREAIIAHGVLLTTLQRLVRLRHSLCHGKDVLIDTELTNCGHGNWDPADFPDWLLLEIDSDILIREEQVDVARAIIAPESGSNSVLQMNMGQGKSRRYLWAQ